MKNLTNNYKVSIFVIILTLVFIYSLTIISDMNKCSWVRIYNSECK